MLISVPELQKWFKLTPSTILHVGAHLAEENDAYRAAGWGFKDKIIWVESQANLILELRDKLDPEHNEIIQATVWHENDIELEFNVSSNSQSSSILKFGTHAKDYPEISYVQKSIVRTKRLDAIIPINQKLDFINLDIQGAELSALKGLGEHLWNVKYIYSEVNKKQVYLGCPHVNEVDNFLRKYGFRRIATRWVFKKGWGDALWVRDSDVKGITKSIFKFRILSRIDFLRQLFHF